jgi:hypothetical protein
MHASPRALDTACGLIGASGSDDCRAGASRELAAEIARESADLTAEPLDVPRQDVAIRVLDELRAFGSSAAYEASRVFPIPGSPDTSTT